jgi:4-amino-4-deoxy-L-arabinose transferase-like glycosyltransferase
MPRLRLVPRAAWLALLVVLLVGGGIRYHEATHPVPSKELSADARSYTTIAQHLATTGNYAGRNGRLKALHWPPATPQVFALAYGVQSTLGGHDAPRYRDDVRVLHYAQFAISTLTLLVVFVLGWVLAGPWAGVAAAAVLAVYPPAYWGPANLLSEPLGALMVTGALTAVALAWRTRLLAWWGTAGALFGGVLLTRTDLLFVPALLALTALLWLGSTVSWRRGLQSAALLVGLCAVVVLPWTIQASDTAGKLVPVTNGGGSAFFVGTYLPGNGSTYDMKFALLDEIRATYPGKFDDTDYKQIPAELVLNMVARRHPDLPRDEALMKEARQNVVDALGHPVELTGMGVFKLGKMWFRATLGGSSTPMPVVRITHVILILVAFVGLLFGVLRRRHPGLVAILLTIATATGVHLIAVAHGRYNLPLMPILIAGGASGWALWIEGWRQRRRSRAAASVG